LWRQVGQCSCRHDTEGRGTKRPRSSGRLIFAILTSGEFENCFPFSFPIVCGTIVSSELQCADTALRAHKKQSFNPQWSFRDTV
jgi:hypothetical protein